MSVSAAHPTALPQIVAHRGDPISCVENTLEAISSAIDGGASVVEIDVRTTADHVPVLLHDATLTRIWGHDAHLSATDAETVAALRSPDGCRIPTLADALALAAGRATLMLDLPSARGAAAIQQVAQGHDVVWCGDHRAMAVVREADPDAVIYLTWNERAYPAEGVLAQLRPTYINPVHLVLDEEWMDWANTRGLRVSTWTVDDPARLDQLRQLGVASVTSNVAAAQRRHLLSKAG